MNQLTQYWRSIPKGTRVLTLLSFFGFLVLLIVRLVARVDLSESISLNESTLAGFQLWRLFTYALVPGDAVGVFFGTLFLILIGPGAERSWSPSFFITYFLVCAAASGVVFRLILGNAPLGLLTNAGALMGLIVAWFQANRFQRFLLFGGPEVSAAVAACVTASFMIVPAALSCGWILTPGIAAGAPAGWLFLRLHARWSDRRQPPTGQRSRVSRIEL